MPAVLWTTDSNLRITSLTGAHYLEEREWRKGKVGETLSDYFGTGDASFEPVRCHIRALAGLPARYEVEVSGHVFDCHIQPLRDPGGEISGTIGLAMDITDARRAADDARRSDQLYRGLVERLDEGFLRVDLEGMVEYVNQRFCGMVGYEREELVGASVLGCRIFAESDQEVIQEALQRRRSGIADRYEVQIHRKSGRPFWARISGAPIFDGHGDRVVSAAALIQDISHERREQNRTRFRFRVTEILASTETTDAAVSEVMEAIRTSFRWCAAEYWRLGPDAGRMVRVLPKDETGPAGPCREAILELVREGAAVWIEDLRTHPRLLQDVVDGEIGEFHAALALPIRIAGAVTGVTLFFSRYRRHVDEDLLAIIDDVGRQLGQVAERRMAVTALREREAQLLEAQRIARMGSWEWDIATNTVRASGQLQELFGLSPPDDPRSFETYRSRVAPEDLESVMRTLDLAYARMEPFSIQYGIILPEGTRRFVRAIGRVLGGENGAPVKMSGTVQDVTEQWLTERELERAQRLAGLGRVVATMTHEFNNVLMGISPFAELVRSRTKDPAVAEAMQRICESVQRGRRVTGDILRFTKTPHPSFSSIEVGQWLRRIAGEIRALLGGRIGVLLHEPSQATFIRGDVQQLSQAVINLALNARDAMPDGGSLTISARPCLSHEGIGYGAIPTLDRYLLLDVADTGSGMERETLDHIFEPLFTTKRNGTGLGLALVHQVVSAHEGRILVDSEVGQGTRFHLLLPLTNMDEAAERAESAPVARLPRRVLLVEDEPGIAEGIAALLALESVAVEIVGEGARVPEAIGRWKPDVVLLDVGLPDMDGTDVYREIVSRWPDLPVVFSTGHGEAAEVRGRLGADVRVLQKPYELDVLLRTLGEVIALGPSPNDA